MARPLQPDHFEALLDRLGPDRNLAGERYVALSRRLLTIFCYRGCPDPEALVNDTLDRAGRKLLELGDRFEGNDPTPYVFGIAWNVARESFRHRAPEPLPEDREIPSPGPADPDGARELRSTCLDECLERLPEDERGVALRYYHGEKGARIRQRAALARELGVSANALRLKVHRITRRLRQCVFNCMDVGGPATAIPRSTGPRLVKG